jgi:hypothetical protein
VPGLVNRPDYIEIPPLDRQRHYSPAHTTPRTIDYQLRYHQIAPFFVYKYTLLADKYIRQYAIYNH